MCIRDRIVTELKTKLKKFKSYADAAAKKHENNLADMAKFESMMVDSISKFNAVTDRYKKEVENLLRDSEKETTSERVLAAWRMISLGLSIQILKEESETSKDRNESMRKAQNIEERNGVRENVAITAKAIIIPSFKKYITSFNSITTFFTELLDDLETLQVEGQKEYFENLYSKSDDIREICRLFPSVMVEVRTDLAV